jgi:DNA polymerase III gamma/tau subunit
MELRRIESAEVFFVQQIMQKEGITSENNLLFGIKQEFQNAMKDNLSKITPKQERMDLHLKLAEFARMFLTFYENQLSNS